MNNHQMLRELGYETSESGISTFQRDFNRLGRRALLVTGKLDDQTIDALRFAHKSRVVFTTLRDRKGV